MSVPDNYQIIQTTSTDAQIRVDIDWDYDSITDLYIWQQDTDTGVITYFNLGDFAVVEKSDGSGDYIEVENVSTVTALVNTARRSPLTQTYDLANSEALDPVALVDALDKAIKILQEQDSITLTPDRQVITSVNPFDIPDKVTRAGKILSFDDNGDVQFTTSDEALDKAIGYAEEWANNPEDQLVSAGAGGDQVDDYSALHHAKKSEDFSQASSTSATNSQNSATASDSSANASASSAIDSSNSASDSSNSAIASLASENKAQKWAEEAEDVEVETGEYSAKHWAMKAEEEAQTVGGKLLATYDMTNGGSNNLSNIDITWQTAWDAYDHVDIVIRNARNSGAGQMAWVLSGDSGTTWESFDGSSFEAIGWSDTNFGGNSTQVFDARMRMVINSVKKTTECIDYSAYLEGVNPNDADNSKIGYVFNYSGTTLTSASQGIRWDGWYTGSTGLDGYLLRLVHGAGNFTSGTLKIIGYNYP